MNTSIRTALAGIACSAALFGALPAAAANVTMNLGWETPLDSDYGVLATKFQELVQQYTNGTVEVKKRRRKAVSPLQSHGKFAALRVDETAAWLLGGFFCFAGGAGVRHEAGGRRSGGAHQEPSLVPGAPFFPLPGLARAP